MQWRLRVLSCLITAMATQVGHAALGGNAADIEAEAQAMKVARPVKALPRVAPDYSVHEIVLSTGTVIHQYVSTSDKVFAVTWSGPSKPDLRQLLGPSFETMNARHARQVHMGHSTVVQHEPDLVVESGGHPRSFAGRAYLPGALPSGLVPADIR
jgi:hypothetical protein